jgi:hypothetical protein
MLVLNVKTAFSNRTQGIFNTAILSYDGAVGLTLA